MRVILGSVIAIGLATSGLGFAGAQNDDEVAEEAPAEGEVDVRRRANLGPQEQLQEARAIQQRGTDLSRRVSAMLDEARQERDIIRVTCVNDKLTQVNANLRTVEQRIDNLEDAVEADDSSRRNHEFTVITVLGQKFVVLDREAAQCIGQDIFETGATRVITEIDPDTPTEDPRTLPDIPPGVIPFVPPPESGTI
ncbi:MAG TPA: hypothetical protein RMH85_25140 [Polyangiaceae bacterium LLY-WYZ-15_(1-7)]|nr:hypothetical protein [Sandaracinus sp.]HJL06165.1 hypothetical protein [Polyangiaceae bacterium LLY-WYZ-15_(1-7)]HJL11786.1 hypothetical protein [Polyangiaceae bacterium LLY-WYZ-15_(1-7)]HJL34429.1 hypothetical protein [Polyangiaceae bacterium LLY-WYZ-15_(1-7)]